MAYVDLRKLYVEPATHVNHQHDLSADHLVTKKMSVFRGQKCGSDMLRTDKLTMERYHKGIFSVPPTTVPSALTKLYSRALR